MRRFQKTVSVFLLICFLPSQVWSQTSPLPLRLIKESVSEARFSGLASRLDIPAPLGSIGSVSEAGPTTIIHIQDAHSSPDAQESIRKILEHLSDTYGLQAVFTEGAIEELDPSLVSFFQSEDRNRKLAALLEGQGLIGGVEKFLLEQTHYGKRFSRIRAYPVEDPALYRQNLEDYRAVALEKETVEKIFALIQSRLLTRSSKILNPKLYDFFRQWIFFEDHASDFTGRLRVLRQAASGQLGLDFQDPLTQLEWPQVYRIFRIETLEKETDAAKAAADQEKLLAWMRGKKLPASEIALIESLGPGKKDAEPSTAVRLELEKFQDRTRAKGFRFADYPDLARFWGLVILRGEIEAADFVSEIERLEKKVFDSLAAGKEEQEFLRIYRDGARVRKLLMLELDAGEFEDLRARSSALRPQTLFAAGEAGAEPEERAQLQMLYEKAFRFYEGAARRDRVIYENMTRKMKEAHLQAAVLITGGFHAAGLERLCREKGLSFVSVSPHMARLDRAASYEKIMTLTADTQTRLSMVDSPTGLNRVSALRAWYPGIGDLYAHVIANAVRSLVAGETGLDAAAAGRLLREAEQSAAFKKQGGLELAGRTELRADETKPARPAFLDGVLAAAKERLGQEELYRRYPLMLEVALAKMEFAFLYPEENK
ncbi:MAG TPA: hypothetical protein VL688_03615, partial [Verrucomicrobiae bacterium]|nr:hypothetical protein [Verrucomicrobiae bacterium]